MENKMNADFQIKQDSRRVEGGQEYLKRVFYKDACIANFVLEFIPNEKGIKKGKKPITYDLPMTPQQYIQTYGYMAEWRRQWLLGNKIEWNDSLLVTVE
jgi:hypothetical protein